jgi:hypothetical protein
VHHFAGSRACHRSELLRRQPIFVVFLRLQLWRKSAIPNYELLERLPMFSLHRRMSEPPHITPKKSVERAAREARLAKALRENLVRRKEQKRAQDRQAVTQSKETDPER